MDDPDFTPTEEQRAQFREVFGLFFEKRRKRLDDTFYAEHPDFPRLECPDCKSTDLVEISCLAWGPYPEYECGSCGRYTGFFKMLFKNCFVVTPLTEEKK